MKRVVSLQYSSGRVLGEAFMQELRGNVYVGVAVLSDEAAAKFENREDFEVEDLDVSEVHDFPADFPLLAPQKAALVRAGLTTLDAVKAHDFKVSPVAGIADKTVTKIQEYFAPTPPAPQARPARRSGRDAAQAPEPKPDEGKPADPPADKPTE